MKKEMLRTIVLAAVSMLPAMLCAQTNPKQGFIITNQNDTVYGTIDYLSDTKCAYSCRFKPDGGAEYKTYQPNDIRAYRFSDDGVFYVTRTFDGDREQKTFFAEYLIEGGVSLFHHKEGDTNYYYFIGEDGNVVVTKDEKQDTFYRNLTDKEKADKRRAALGEVNRIFTKSDKALHELWTKDINARNLSRVTQEYNMKYCTSAGDCVSYRYDEKVSSSVSARFLVQAGIGFGSNKLKKKPSEYVKNNDVTMNTAVPEIGIGVDLAFPRFNKNLSVQARVLLSRWSMSDDYIARDSDTKPTSISLKYWDLGFQVGPAYSFLPQSKFSPVLRAGFAMETPLGIKKTNFDYLAFDSEDNPTIQAYGFYVGGGVDIAIQKHILRVTAEYQWTHSPNDEVDFGLFAIKAGFAF